MWHIWYHICGISNFRVWDVSKTNCWSCPYKQQFFFCWGLLYIHFPQPKNTNPKRISAQYIIASRYPRLCGMYDIKKAKPNFPKIHQQSMKIHQQSINPSSIHQSIINPSSIHPIFSRKLPQSPTFWHPLPPWRWDPYISAPHRRTPGCVGRSAAWPGCPKASVRTDSNQRLLGIEMSTPTLSFINVSVYRCLSMYQYLLICIDIYRYLSIFINVYQCLSMFVVYQRSSTIENHFPKTPWLMLFLDSSSDSWLHHHHFFRKKKSEVYGLYIII